MNTNFYLSAMKLFTYLMLLMALNTACQKPGVAGDPDSASTEQGIVKGRVVDSQGNGVANAEIIANSTDYYNKTSSGYTDAGGNYRIKLPGGVAEGSYSVNGTVTINYHNNYYKMALYEENTRMFSAYEGAVRNFVFTLTGKRSVDADETDMPLGATLEVYHDFNVVNAGDVEVTLEPVGPLVDGSAGKKIVTGLPTANHSIMDIPLGNYKITACDKANNRQLGVTIHDSGKAMAPSVTGIFTDNPIPGSTVFDMGLIIGAL